MECQLKLFDKTVVPILLYGSEICDYESYFAIEKNTLRVFKKHFKNEEKYTTCYDIWGIWTFSN